MNMFIPPHLRKLNVVEQLWKMFIEYNIGVDDAGNRYYKSEKQSFSDYQAMLKIDPVRKFLNECISKESIPEGQEYEAVITYLSHLFYSVKGTSRVIDFMEKYLTSIEFKSEIEYTTKSLIIELDKINTNDLDEFKNMLMDFLNALLYFENGKDIEAVVKVDSIELKISEKIITKLGITTTPINNESEITFI